MVLTSEMAQADYYANGAVEHMRAQIHKAENSLWYKLKLRYVWKITPEKYVRLMEACANFYSLKHKTEMQLSGLTWDLLYLMSDEKRGNKNFSKKQYAELQNKRVGIVIEKNAYEESLDGYSEELEKYGLSISHCI